MRSWLCAQERLNPEVVSRFGAAAQYLRTTAGNSHDDTLPENSTLDRVEFTLFRCTSADLFFLCCDSVSSPRQRPGHHDQVPAKNNERRRGNRPRRTRVFQRFTRVFTRFRCTSAGLCFSCCGSVAAPWQRPRHCDQVPAKNNERRRGHRPRHHDQVPATHSGRRYGQRPVHHDQLPARRRGQRPGATMKYLRRTTSIASGSTLSTTINEHSPAMNNKRRSGKRPGQHD